MRFRVRGLLPDGRPVLVKPDADDAFAAAGIAGKMLAADGHQLSNISNVTVRAMKAAKSSVYIGKAREKGTRKPKTAEAASTTSATPAKGATSPATPAKGATPAKK